MKEYKATDPEMIQAQKDLAKLSNLSDRVITNDKDLFEELATIQRKLCQISELKAHFLQRYEDILDEQHNLETQLCVFQMRCSIASSYALGITKQKRRALNSPIFF